MSNPSKQKGTAAEVAVRDYLRANGYPQAERLPTEGAKDRGDIAGGPHDVTIEVKNCKTMDLAGWLAEAKREAESAGTSVGVIVHKKRGTTDVGAWYVTLDVDSFLGLCDRP